MYLRHSTIRKNGKTRTYWRLVRSVRVGYRVKQKTVAQLGELDAEGCAKASALAEHFLGPKARQRELFEDRTSVKPAKVHIGKVCVERRPGGRGNAPDIRAGRAWACWASVGAEKNAGG